MKKIIIISIFILQFSFLFAQTQHFSKFWGTASRSETVTDIFEVNNNAFFIAAFKYNENLISAESIILKLDSNCNVIDSLQLKKYHANSTKIYSLFDFKHMNSKIIGHGYMIDTVTHKLRIWLSELDEDLNIIRDTVLGNEDSLVNLYSSFPLITSQNQLLLTLGFYIPLHDSTNMQVWLVDSNFNIIKENSLSTHYQGCGFSVMEMVSNQSFHIITENDITKIKQSDLSKDTVVWNLNGVNFYGGRGALAINDSVYIHPGSSSFYQYPYNFVNYIVLNKRDKNGNSVGSILLKDFYQTFEKPLYNMVDFITTDSIFVAGSNYALGLDWTDTEDNNVFIWNISLNGNINWQQYYNTGKKITVFDMTKTSDGGCFLTGQIWDWHNVSSVFITDVFFLKVDRNGNVVGSLGINEKIKQSDILVYPNPVRENITFNTGMYSNYQLSIFNALGQTVLQQHCNSSQNTFSIQDFQQGMYYYRLLTDHGKVISGKFVKE